MKTTAIACAVLAGSFGFASLASADDGRGRRGDDRGDRAEQRQERREARAERRDDRREVRRDRQDQRQDRAYRQGYQAGAVQQPRHVYQQPRHVYQQPRHVYQQPSYTHSQPSYRTYNQRFHRGGYLPSQYRSHGYYVNNWNAYPGLYAPPHGHQWMQVGSDFLLVAIATGLIANLLTN
jgi:Ni/Co efflux regulator RcnB